MIDAIRLVCGSLLSAKEHDHDDEKAHRQQASDDDSSNRTTAKPRRRAFGIRRGSASDCKRRNTEFGFVDVTNFRVNSIAVAGGRGDVSDD